MTSENNSQNEYNRVDLEFSLEYFIHDHNSIGKMISPLASVYLQLIEQINHMWNQNLEPKDWQCDTTNSVD